MSYFDRVRKAANKYGVHPFWFVVIYIATIPPCVVAGGWFAEGLLQSLPWTQLAFRLLLAWLFFQAPSIYVMVFGKNLPAWIVCLIVCLMTGVGWLNFGFSGVAVVVIFLSGLVIVKTWLARKRLPTTRVAQIDPSAFLEEILKKFRRDYKKAPWLEDKRCQVCVPDRDFSKGGTVDEVCSVHNCATVQYWDTNRVRDYLTIARLSPDFIALGVFSTSGELVGITWGFHKDVGGYAAFYVDVIILDPEYRVDRRSLHGSLISSIVALKLRFRPHQSSVLDLLIKWIGCPPLGDLYLELVRRLPLHLSALATRTHRNAENVQRVLRIAGYQECAADPNAPERVFYVMPTRR